MTTTLSHETATALQQFTSGGRLVRAERQLLNVPPSCRVVQVYHDRTMDRAGALIRDARGHSMHLHAGTYESLLALLMDLARPVKGEGKLSR